MLDQVVFQHSRSPWHSPLFLDPKQDGSFRPVIDFRKVNEVTEDNRYPLPVLGDLLMSLGQGNTIFSRLDFLSGYWQVLMSRPVRFIFLIFSLDFSLFVCFPYCITLNKG